MKKKFNKIMALTLACAMMTGLAACGSSDSASTDAGAATDTTAATTSTDTTTDAADTGDTAGAYADYSNGFSERVTIQIPVYDRAFEGWDVTNNTYTKWVQEEFGEKYNVDVEFVAIGRSTEVADFTQMIGAGTAPNIIFHYDMPQAVNYYSEGAMQALDLDEIAYYAPNYYANLSDTIKTYGEMDGETYFFFAERPTMYYQWVTLIRQDWLEAVNMEMPTSLEELNEVAAAWKEAGLGTLGGSLSQNNFTYYYGFIGNSVDETELALNSDLSVPPMTWEATKEYLKNLNYQVNNGLIDPEFYLKTDDALTKADFVAGKTGTYGLYLSNSTDVMSSLLANNPEAKIAALPTRAGVPEGNNPYYYEYPPYGMIMGINSTTTEEQRAAVWMYLEWLSDKDNLFKFQNGVEGENYDFDADGLAVQKEGYTGEWSRSNNNNKDYWCLVVEAATYDDPDLTYKANVKNWAPAGYEYLIDDSYSFFLDQEQYGLLNTVFTKTVESSADNAADLRTLWTQLYVGCATCPEADFEATYEDACSQFLDAGYQDILDEKQSLMDEGSVK